MGKHSNKQQPSGWDSLADWYDGWVGKDGSEHHRKLIIPAALEMLALQSDDQVLDVGSGQGVFASHVRKAGAHYTGVEISPRLVTLARKHHPHATFLKGDARHLQSHPQLESGCFDAVLFMLSIQDMNPLVDVLHAAAWAMRGGGRLVILMTHPCFRVPRQSGWGYDQSRKLQYRRVDRYLTPLKVPIKQYGRKKSGVSISFHRPLESYISGLAEAGLLVDCMREITSYKQPQQKSQRLAEQEIPLFLGIRAWKV